MKKIGFIKSAVICTIVLCTVILLHSVLKWKDTNGDYLSSVQQLYATDNNLIDVAFVGSSHCYCGIHPNFLWENYGIAAFDMSVSGQDKIAALHQLKELFKTQKPKIVIVDLFAVTYDRQSVAANEYRNYLSLRPSVNSLQAINEYVSDEDKNDFLFRFPIIHSRYRELTKYDFVNYKPNEFGRGELISFTTTPFDNSPTYILPEDSTEVISNVNKKWIEDLISLCKENGSEIAFMLLPLYVTEKELDTVAGAEKYLSEIGIECIDINRLCRELGIDPQRDFRDETHLNSYGAKKATEYIGRLIKENLDIPDRRGNAEYYQWDLDVNWYYNEESKQKLIEAETAREFAKAVKEFNDGYTVISLEGNYSELDSEYFDGCLSFLGMNYDEYSAGGKWIYQKETLVKVAENNAYSGEYFENLSKYDTLRICFTETYNPENIMIGNNSLQTKNHLTFAVYDKLIEEFVINKGF